MLTLKCAAYTPEELEVLQEVVIKAYMEISCESDCYCPTCPRKHVCEDLARLNGHLAKLNARKTRESDDS